ncbi:MAG: hypothetical protein KKA60_06830 [Proteobacteria bacterium]|nr:hypothetical protein [Pseudomonadota bacterium]
MSIAEITPQEFDLFRSLIEQKVGIGLTQEKRRFLGRKLARRIKELSLSSYASYYRLVGSREGEAELARLLGMVTIGQTQFFRGDHQFTLFADKLLPQILERKKDGGRVRFWSAACSMGQEPYSIAILLLEKTRQARDLDMKILATDVDRESLRFAHAGRYPGSVKAEVPSPYLSRHFKLEKGPGGEGYRVREEVRRLISFRTLNLLTFPYPMAGPFDAVWLRNTMIYFGAPAKKAILAEVQRLLVPGGFLCLGGSESLLGLDARFSLLSHAVYVKS